MHWLLSQLQRVEAMDGDTATGHYAWAVDPVLDGHSFSIIDLRPLGLMADTNDAGAGSRHLCLVRMQGAPPGQLPSSLRYLGDGPRANVPPAARQAIARAAGLPSVEARNIRDLVREVMLERAHPDGADGPRPIMPGRKNRIRLPGLRLTCEWDRLPFRKVLQAQRMEYKATRQAGHGKHRMWLAAFMDIRAIPRKGYRYLQDGQAPDEAPVDPATPITESFPGTSATYGGDLSWTEYDSGFQNSSGKAFKSGSSQGTARCDTDLSGGDMYSRMRCDAGAYGWLDNAVRFSASVQTAYWTITRNADNPSKTAWIRKRISGSDTELASHIGSVKRYTSSDYYSKLDIIGSDLELFADPDTTSRLTATDTAIGSSNVRAGNSGRDSGGNAYGLEWEADSYGASSIAVLRRRREGE